MSLLKKPGITSLFLLLTHCFVVAQTCAECRYIAPVFDSVTVSTVKFGRGARADGSMQDLYMDIYQPYGDTAINRPLAIFAFGGAFVTGSRDDWYVVLVCEHLARAGYVVASIDYRIYNDAGELASEVASGLLISGVPYHMRIFFRPMQDMRAAVQYFKADYAELGNTYRIDTSRILIGGASSGGITALMVAYCDKPGELGELGAGSLVPIDALGGFYSTSGFYPTYSWKARAVFQVSGALLSDDWIEPGDIPVISAHGNADDIVPYGTGPFSGLTLGFFNMYGSAVVDSAARANGVCSYLFTMEGKGHPSESFGIEYLKSVVYRLMLRMHAVIHDRSFCCPLSVETTPTDTLFYQPHSGPQTVHAQLQHSQGQAHIQWCSIDCFETSSGPGLTFEPRDTAFKYVACIASEDGCQDAELITLRYLPPDTVNIAAGQHPADNNVRVYPVPATGELNLQGIPKYLNGKDMLITISDVTGRVVFSQRIASSGNMNVKLPCASAQPGCYVLSLAATNGVFHRQLILLQ
ncbi:MAG: hypothetical protein KatS3mg031_0679 [Chitinophagales bacterium]|nr:MAG: hypothetical protein KatS3mg031_0679 [Chitinophagales bacterium]